MSPKKRPAKVRIVALRIKRQECSGIYKCYDLGVRTVYRYDIDESFKNHRDKIAREIRLFIIRA